MEVLELTDDVSAAIFLNASQYHESVAAAKHGAERMRTLLNYVVKLGQVETWRRALTGQLDWVEIWRALCNFSGRKYRSNVANFPVRRIRGGRNVVFIWGEKDPKRFCRVRDWMPRRVTIKGSDRSFDRREHSAQVIELVCDIVLTDIAGPA
jgi:hypothetical protein